MNSTIKPDKKTTVSALPRLADNRHAGTGNLHRQEYMVELISGNDVMDLLSQSWFQREWDSLYESCPWATIFQQRQFVTGWYQVYRQQHLPIVVRATRAGRLCGLLTMTLLNGGTDRNNGDRVTGAGHYDAIYQVWLAMPAYADNFIQQALTMLLSSFRGVPVSFRYLPPQTSMQWINTNKKWQHLGILQPYSRPLINLTDEQLPRITQRNHFKSKYNRLKKSGEVKFEHVRSLGDFEACLADVAIMYDFRQGAMFNKNHFLNDPLKKDFLLEMFRLQLLHVSVLKVNGTIIASIASLAGSHSVHLSGYICHSPFGSKFNSPGYLHFALLAKQLAEEKFQYFDLTPGYDSYKEQFANQHDEVYEWTLSNKKAFRIKRRGRKWMHGRMVRAGIRPMTAELQLKKFFYRLRNRSIGSIIKKWTSRLTGGSKNPVYTIDAAQLKRPVTALALRKNSLEDLLQFNSDKKAGLTRWDFLSDALYRVGKGEYCYTWVEADRLLGYAWLDRPDTFAAQKEEAVQTDGILLQNIYCHPSATDRLGLFLESVALAAQENAVTVPVRFQSADKRIGKALMEAGYRVFA